MIFFAGRRSNDSAENTVKNQGTEARGETGAAPEVQETVVAEVETTLLNDMEWNIRRSLEDKRWKLDLEGYAFDDSLVVTGLEHIDELHVKVVLTDSCNSEVKKLFELPCDDFKCDYDNPIVRDFFHQH
ncbi:hypothetical protein CYMTET_26197 [Cymbomonas tetramitiformis]|uniref:Uncharacterized protein n=1 Tax=Cymbomonas tetramitiformis TaxID=36881 RepID=A0AAE0FS95_9CHLO|nr:hypothetical protein CYMTET_26197 [Cymbomonas tetramitiformis]